MHSINSFIRLLKRVLAGCICSLIIFHQAVATQNEDYFNFLNNECFFASTNEFNDTCNNAFGIPDSDPAQITSFGSTSNNSSEINSINDYIDERKDDNTTRTAIGIGILASRQSADTDRINTELESGYSADLTSTILGIDYAINDHILIGLLNSSSDNDATIINNGGTLNTDSDALIFYGNIIAHQHIGIDFYIGDTDNDYISTRNYEIQNLSGTATGNYTGEQSLQGLTVYTDWAFDQFSIGASYAIDESDTDINGYNEAGTAGFEIIFPDQSITSKQETFSLYTSYQLGFDWGQIIPTASYSSIKEKKNDARNIETSLVLSPTSSFTFRTDAPDRNYAIRSFGVNIALNSGLLFFINQERQSSHRFISSDATAFGVLYAF